jgi:hypothetical protein
VSCPRYKQVFTLLALYLCARSQSSGALPPRADPPKWRRPCRGLPAGLLAEILVEKLGNLAEHDGGFRQAIVEQVLRVRLTFVDLEFRLHSGRASARWTRTVLLSSRSLPDARAICQRLRIFPGRAASSAHPE